MKNNIAIFKNKKKLTPNHPDYNGKIEIVEELKPGRYEVSIFLNEYGRGEKYMKGIIREEFKPKKDFSKDNFVNHNPYRG